MKKQSRRTFLKISALSAASVAGVSSSSTKASSDNILQSDRMGVLVDTTVCIGCRNCEWACRKTHDIEAGKIDSYSDRSVLQEIRRPDTDNLTVVNEYSNPDKLSRPIDVKFQCMHCNHPACVSACIVGAISKNENGAVIWDTDKCIGCRYCMVACPFQVPAFEYDKAIDPKILKCDFCFEQTVRGKLPACVDICPMEALTYGPLSELINLARKRIKSHPDRYTDYIYGEKEVGGTSWLYLASTDFDKIGFPKLSEHEAPGVSESIQHGIFAYFVPPVSLYALLGGIMWITKKRSKEEEENLK